MQTHTQELLIGGWGADGEGSAPGIAWVTAHCESHPRSNTADVISFEDHGCVATMPSPSWLCRRGNTVFACLEFSNELVSYRCDFSAADDQNCASQRLEMTAISRVSTPGNGPTHIALCTDDEGHTRVVSACYADGTVTVHPVDDEGHIASATQSLHGEGRGPLPAQEHAHAHWILPIPADAMPMGDGHVNSHLVLVSDLGADRIRTYRWEQGMLVPQGVLHLPAGTGPRDLHLVPAHIETFHASTAIMLISEWSREAFVLRSDAYAPAGISIVQRLSLGASDEDQASSLAYVPDETQTPEQGFAYVGLRGTNRIIPLRWNGSTLSMVRDDISGSTDNSWHSGFPSGGSWPRHILAIDRYLCVANQYSSTITAFRIDADGKPVQNGAATVASPTCIMPMH